jgi:cytochrome c peroxidase
MFPQAERLWWAVGGMVVVAVVSGGIAMRVWATGDTQPAQAQIPEPADWVEPIEPIQAMTNLDARKIALGRKLFNDPRLSRNNQVACSNCHNLKTGGTDGKGRSIGIGGAMGVINAPTVFNSGFNFSQFWDGRARRSRSRSTDQSSQPWRWVPAGPK